MALATFSIVIQELMMAEAGIIASVITIAQILIPAVKQARTFFKAGKELKELQASVSVSMRVWMGRVYQI